MFLKYIARIRIRQSGAPWVNLWTCFRHLGIPDPRHKYRQWLQSLFCIHSHAYRSHHCSSHQYAHTANSPRTCHSTSRSDCTGVSPSRSIARGTRSCSRSTR
ncbi:hypothetical protein FGO68_gene2549 [Halteria grandinella]|uniref:Uncharacterized protein n=1 Tax=Halteria grandinella TaxID=5974 RepID=A0A8J8NEV2_HALGN|nr:hypothetical protein FGO68_gene2549 [Halteria grandinella]